MAHKTELPQSHRSFLSGESVRPDRMYNLIHTLFSCDPERGVLIWKVKRGRSVIGHVAGTLNCKGYWQIQINRKLYLAHRLIWLYVHGRWPESELDHIDGNCSNNRIENLREATRSDNQHNQKMRCDNSSGVKGVSWSKAKGKWYAQCVVKNKTHFIGLFDDLNLADAAIREFREKHHGRFANHGCPEILRGVMTKAEKLHLSRVAELCCIVCRNEGLGETPAEIHHCSSGTGLSVRADNFHVIPPCPIHHRQGGYGIAIHAGRQSWESHYGTERELLAQVLQLLGESVNA